MNTEHPEVHNDIFNHPNAMATFPEHNRYNERHSEVVQRKNNKVHQPSPRYPYNSFDCSVSPYVSDADEIFGKVIGCELKEISDQREKDLLKLHIIQLLFTSKYKTNLSPTPSNYVSLQSDSETSFTHLLDASFKPF